MSPILSFSIAATMVIGWAAFRLIDLMARLVWELWDCWGYLSWSDRLGDLLSLAIWLAFSASLWTLLYLLASYIFHHL